LKDFRYFLCDPPIRSDDSSSSEESDGRILFICLFCELFSFRKLLIQFPRVNYFHTYNFFKKRSSD